jgi:hypothetical protein
MLTGMVLAGLVGSVGCHQHHYYLSPQQAALIPDPGVTIAQGDFCDLPSGTVVTSGTPILTRTSPVVSGPVVIRSPSTAPMVVSQPRGNTLFSGQSWGWQAADPERRVTIRAEGAYQGDTVVR